MALPRWLQRHIRAPARAIATPIYLMTVNSQPSDILAAGYIEQSATRADAVADNARQFIAEHAGSIDEALFARSEAVAATAERIAQQIREIKPLLAHADGVSAADPRRNPPAGQGWIGKL